MVFEKLAGGVLMRTMCVSRAAHKLDKKSFRIQSEVRVTKAFAQLDGEFVYNPYDSLGLEFLVVRFGCYGDGNIIGEGER